MFRRKLIPPGMNFRENAIYTPDGKFLVVLAANTIFDKPDTKRFLFFFYTANSQLARQLNVTSWSPPVVNDEMALKSNLSAPPSRSRRIAGPSQLAIRKTNPGRNRRRLFFTIWSKVEKSDGRPIRPCGSICGANREIGFHTRWQVSFVEHERHTGLGSSEVATFPE